MMRIWQEFLDSLDSDGGKILLLMLMTLTGLVGLYYKVNKAEDLFVGAGASLLTVLKMIGSNQDRRTGSVQVEMTRPTVPGEKIETVGVPGQAQVKVGDQ